MKAATLFKLEIVLWADPVSQHWFARWSAGRLYENTSVALLLNCSFATQQLYLP